MARTLDGSPKALTYDGSYGGTFNNPGYPFSMGCWFRIADVSVSIGRMLFLGNETVANQWWSLLTDTSGPRLRGFTHNYGGINTRNVYGTTTLLDNTWHHGCLVGNAYNDRRLYTDGGDKQTDTGTVGNTNLQMGRFGVGWLGDSTPSYSDDSDIDHVFLYDVALTDAEVALLGAGADPRVVRPASLIAYYRLDGNSPEVNLAPGFSGHNLTVTGSPAFVTAPKVVPALYQTGARNLTGLGAVGGSFNVNPIG